MPTLQTPIRRNDTVLVTTGKDSGINSDRDNSGGEQVNLSPGFSARLGSRFTAFGFVEFPLYNRVNGYQLAPHAKASFGVLMNL